MADREQYYAHIGRAALALGAVGLVAFVVGLIVAPQRAWGSLMIGNYYFLAISIGGTVFVALNRVFGSGWATRFRRIPEAMSAYLPIGALILIATFLAGGSYLYPWLRQSGVAVDPHLEHKRAFLNPAMYLTLSVLTFVVWIGGSLVVRRLSKRPDSEGNAAHAGRSGRVAGAFLVLFGITFILASFAWIMSLTPMWTSTMFPLYTFAGMLTVSAAAMAVLVIRLSQHGLLPGITRDHVYELARLVCAAASLWAYIWFCQYVLIYYTNIPEEAIYFANRRTGPWSFLFLSNVAITWAVPALMLITNRAQRSTRMVERACWLVLLGQWLDVTLMVVPTMGFPFRLDPLDILVPLGLVPLFLLPFMATFRGKRAVHEQGSYSLESR